ncbi:MAG TPA: 16S rRNA (cytosine(967)-C(5))-methyltransferase RsmB [Pyrinomonadaceae bacterium]
MRVVKKSRGAKRGSGAQGGQGGGGGRSVGDERRAARPDARRASAARRAAFEVLRRVEEEGAFAAPLLASVAEELRADDRALCYELVLGCLRRQLWLDRLMQLYAGREASSVDAPVRRALRLGLYQLRFLSRVPASAAVNESVNLMHEAGLRSATKFVNAVLRRATREPERDPAEGIEDWTERVSVETSHPAWLVARWAASFGAEEAEAFARANNRTPPTAFRVNPLRAESAEVLERLREAGAEPVESSVAPGAFRLEGGGGGVALLRELAERGFVYMQDEASQLVAHVLGARRSERVLDACAAPGSKTTQLAALAGDAAFIVAGDLYGHRLRLVEEAAARQNLKSIRCVVYDAEQGLPFADASFERVLVDAPCTGTGTLRHNPEIRWRIRASDIAELAARQQRILEAASRAVRPGGRLVYSTCSVEPEENESVVSAFLADRSDDFRQLPASPASTDFLTPSGAARIWPHRDDTDGFFVAAFERRS